MSVLSGHRVDLVAPIAGSWRSLVEPGSACGQESVISG